MVPQATETNDRLPKTASKGENSYSESSQRGPSSPTLDQATPDCMQIVRTAIQEQGISGQATEIILKSWRLGTTKQYRTYIREWTAYCSERNFDPSNPTLGQALDFLTELVNKGLGYSALNTARSALSCVITPINSVPFGSQPLVIRFMKGVYDMRPSLPRYSVTWDVKTVLQFLATKHPASSLSLKDLTLKLVMLASLLSGQRGQSIQYLDLSYMTETTSSFTFTIANVVKQSKAGTKQPIVKFEAYTIDERLCVVTVLREYIQRTAPLRGQNTQLLLSYVKPFGPISRDTVSRWVKTVMQQAGIDTQKFKPHSTRAASSSAAKLKTVPLETILEAAGWSSDCVFAKYYDKNINKKSFALGVLQACN